MRGMEPKPEPRPAPGATRSGAEREWRIGWGVLAYSALLLGALLLPSQLNIMASVWPAAGVGLAWMLRVGPGRRGPFAVVLLVAGVSINRWFGRPWSASAGFMAANVLESLLGAWILDRWSPGRVTFGRVREVVGLILVAVVGNAVTSLLAAAVVMQAVGAAFWTGFLTWWVADGLGLLLVTPLVLAWARETPPAELAPPGGRWEGFAMMASTLGLGLLALHQGSPFFRPYMLFVLVGWGALRFGLRGVTLQSLMVAILGLGWTLAAEEVQSGWGQTLSERLLSMQLFVAIAGGMGLALAASLSERLAVQRQLRLRSLVLDQMRDRVVITDLDGLVTFVNAETSRDSGRSQDSFVGRSAEEVFPGSALGPDGFRRLLAQARRDGGWRGEVVVNLSEGERVFDARTHVIQGPDGIPIGLFGVGHDITASREARRALEESERRYRILAARVQAAREEERIRIAREIHDVLAQELTGLKLGLAWLQRRASTLGGSGDRGKVSEQVAGMVAAVDSAIRSVQQIATDLRPVVLDSLGLGAAVEWQVRDFQERSGIRASARVSEAGGLPERSVATALYRILQESLTNVARHAHATEVEVELDCAADATRLSIRDDGCGMLPGVLDNPASIGLVGMRERALLLGGGLEIRSVPGNGTQIVATVPASGGGKPGIEGLPSGS